jgi:uncharacterized protein
MEVSMKEVRVFDIPVEAREAGENTATISGYASIFDTPYEVGAFTESVSRSAFTKSLKDHRDHAVVWSHDVDRVLGTEESGTARFLSDDTGLRYEADLDLLDPDGISAYRKIATGKVRQSSFSFEAVKDEWSERDDGGYHRTLKEVRLFEASPVLWGASPATTVDVQRAARSLALATERDADEVEAAIREGHLSATTQEPEPEPEIHSEPTLESEPVSYHIPGLI